MFETLEDFGDALILLIDPNKAITAVALFESVFIAWATLYVIFLGFSYVWGKTTTPIRDVTEKFIIFFILGLFTFNMGDYYKSAITAITDLNDWGIAVSGNTLSIFASLDLLSIKLDELSEVLIKNDKAYFYHFEALFGIFFIYAAYYAFGLVAAFLVIINSIALKLLIFSFPIAVVSLFFPPVKDIFGKWLHLLIANTLTMLFIYLFFTEIFDLIKIEIALIQLFSKDIAITSVAFEIVAYFIAGIFLFKMSVTFAEKLSSASLERIAGNAAKGTAAGVVGSAYAGGKAASSAASGTGAILTGRKNASGRGGGGGKLGGGIVGVGASTGRGAHSVYKKGKSALSSRAAASQAEKMSAGRMGIKPRGARSGGAARGGGSGSKSSSVSGSKSSNSGGANKSSKWAQIGSINRYKRAKDGE